MFDDKAYFGKWMRLAKVRKLMHSLGYSKFIYCELELEEVMNQFNQVDLKSVNTYVVLNYEISGNVIVIIPPKRGMY